MIQLYYGLGPNPQKVVLLLEELGLEYTFMPIDTRVGEQHTADFRSINPNGKVPAILDLDAPSSEPVRVFDSTAILLYLAEKARAFLGRPEDRGELLSWLMFIATGLGPYSGQSVHFHHAAPEKLAYAINRYHREVERHYEVLDRHLLGRRWLVGQDYSIADISAWGWVGRASFALPGNDNPLVAYPQVKRWFNEIEARPAAQRAKTAADSLTFKTDMDDAALRALFPSNYPRIA